MKINKNIFFTCFMAVLLLGLSLWSWLKESDRYSDSERRVLASAPEVSADTIFSGDFMEDFETYTQDQFPLRDTFRTLKALTAYHLFGQSDNNDLYLADGHVSQLNYPLKETMLEHAAGRFRWIYDNLLAGTDVNLYFSIIPDKNYYLAEENGYLSLNYPKLIETMREKTDYMKYIDLTDLLSADDYYRTDTHWRQENLTDVAKRLLEEMGATVATVDDTHIWNTLDHPFYGVYYGQSALPLKPDVIKYITGEVLDDCIVTSYDTGIPAEAHMYDMEAATGRDPYEMFLSGSDALITVENPMASTDRELILFRDSFASSLAPLLVESYAKITLVDIRYVQSAMLKNFIPFENQDVLFLYSTLLLNDSLGMK